eukprot:s38_g18.t1
MSETGLKRLKSVIGAFSSVPLFLLGFFHLSIFMVASNDAAEAAEAEAGAAATDAASASSKAQAAQVDETQSALVVSNAGSTSWDRFGARLGDMPFLNSVFENPLFDRVFGETEIAASIREMKVPGNVWIVIPHLFIIAMGLATSVECDGEKEADVDSVDAETLPLKILLNEVAVKTPSQEVQQNAWDEEEKEQLRRKNYQLRHEKNYWRDYARELEKERNQLREEIFFNSLKISSPLTQCVEKIYRPDSYCHDHKMYKTNCPCCRRPLEIALTNLKQEWISRPSSQRYCFATALWGANAGYALGALVLGQRLKELSPEIERVIIHTDDVPSNYLEAFEKDGLWQLRRVDYIDGVADLYVSKGNIFDGVFTKLQAWTLHDFTKVLLLDLDIIPLKPMDDLFNLRCPAAMVRGQGENAHGEEVDGRRFFGGEDNKDYPWGQQGGINAGLILLQPDLGVFEQMRSEVTCKCHPCHVAGNGPEQDYLSRFFAARRESPWHQISVAWNYQLHQSLFAIERVLQWKVFMDNSKTRDFSQADNEWLPQRLRMGVEDIGVVHFSGEVKMWHRFLTAVPPSDDRRREVHHAATSATTSEESDEAFAQYLLSIQRGHSLWVSKTAEPEDYQISDTDSKLVKQQEKRKNLRQGQRHVRDTYGNGNGNQLVPAAVPTVRASLHKREPADEEQASDNAWKRRPSQAVRKSRSVDPRGESRFSAAKLATKERRESLQQRMREMKQPDSECGTQ